MWVLELPDDYWLHLLKAIHVGAEDDDPLPTLLSAMALLTLEHHCLAKSQMEEQPHFICVKDVLGQESMKETWNGVVINDASIDIVNLSVNLLKHDTALLLKTCLMAPKLFELVVLLSEKRATDQ